MTYQLIRSARKTLGVQVKDGKVLVRAPLHAEDADIQRFLQKNAAWIKKQLQKAAERERAYRGIVPLTEHELKELVKQAKEAIPVRVAHYAALLGVTYGRITVRCQKTRWGSCTEQGNLNFNCLLMLAPTEVMDSVIVHELCHRREMNHSKRFYAEIARVCPDYAKWHAWLHTNGEALMRRLRTDQKDSEAKE